MEKSSEVIHEKDISYSTWVGPYETKQLDCIPYEWIEREKSIVGKTIFSSINFFLAYFNVLK